MSSEETLYRYRSIYTDVYVALCDIKERAITFPAPWGGGQGMLHRAVM